MNEQNQQLEELPRDLIQALRNEESVSILVPKAVDEAILRSAADQFGQRPKQPRSWRVPAAIAATLTVGLVAVQLIRSPDLEGDIDGSGQVDVLDVFALARMKQNDSQIVIKDIESLMTRIVSLDEPST